MPSFQANVDDQMGHFVNFFYFLTTKHTVCRKYTKNKIIAKGQEAKMA